MTFFLINLALLFIYNIILSHWFFEPKTIIFYSFLYFIFIFYNVLLIISLNKSDSLFEIIIWVFIFTILNSIYLYIFLFNFINFTTTLNQNITILTLNLIYSISIFFIVFTVIIIFFDLVYFLISFYSIKKVTTTPNKLINLLSIIYFFFYNFFFKKLLLSKPKFNYSIYRVYNKLLSIYSNIRNILSTFFKNVVFFTYFLLFFKSFSGFYFFYLILLLSEICFETEVMIINLTPLYYNYITVDTTRVILYAYKNLISISLQIVILYMFIFLHIYNIFLSYKPSENLESIFSIFLILFLIYIPIINQNFFILTPQHCFIFIFVIFIYNTHNSYIFYSIWNNFLRLLEYTKNIFFKTLELIFKLNFFFLKTQPISWNPLSKKGSYFSIFKNNFNKLPFKK